MIDEDDDDDDEHDAVIDAKQKHGPPQADLAVQKEEDNQLDFLDVMLRSEANVRKGNELLLRAVRTFE